jgi:antitoxin PrlF
LDGIDKIRNYEYYKLRGIQILLTGSSTMTNLLQLRSNGQMTLPATIRKQARVKEGDSFEAHVDEEGVFHLVPQVVIERSQLYFWSDRWQDGERETDEDLRAGRYEDFEDIETLIEELEAENG